MLGKVGYKLAELRRFGAFPSVFYVDRYIETYPQMKELMHETVNHVAGASKPAAAAGA